MKLDLAKYKDMRICVAVSGGKDSMALLQYLYTNAGDYGIVLSALNCDHKIRGEASARDSEFVVTWCKSHGVPVMFAEWNTDLPGTEANARLWRLRCYLMATKSADVWKEYGFTANVYSCNGKWTGADTIATAHHINDNAETVLFNLARGSALFGLKGITDAYSDKRGLKMVRPLLTVSREEIDGYIVENRIPYVEDETNFTDNYTRNKIRHNVLPELEKAIPGATKAIYRFSRLAAEDEKYFDNIITERGLIKYVSSGLEIKHCEEKVIFSRAVVKALISMNVKDYTCEHINRLYELQFAENGKKFEFLAFTAFKENGRITICEKGAPENCGEEIKFSDFIAHNSTIYRGQLLKILINEDSEYSSDTDGIKILKFDCSAIPESAVIRFMQPGDRFTKYGGGTKNLGDYFTDKKIPQRVRQKIPLIAVGVDIYAVCGVEISDKIKILGETECVSYIISKDYKRG